MVRHWKEENLHALTYTSSYSKLYQLETPPLKSISDKFSFSSGKHQYAQGVIMTKFKKNTKFVYYQNKPSLQTIFQKK